MKINVKKTIKQLDGKDLVDNDRTIVLRDVFCSALLYDKSPGQLDPMDKFTRGKLAQKIWDASETEEGIVELTLEEISLIKKLVGELFTPIIVYQVWDYLENLY